MEKIVSLFITMTMMITPSVTLSNPANEPTSEPITAVSEPTAVPAEEPSAVPIEYDDTAEREAHYMRGFKITDAEKTADGYKITYTLETFLEGRGTVGVMFNCFDAEGNVVDTFGDGFVGTDYTWSEHNSTAVISDKTVKIGLVLN